MRYIYGPVLSKRLGYSLGIDLVPRKTCTFDCLYCQLGRCRTTRRRRSFFVNEKTLVSELCSVVSKKQQIDYVTVSGSGEPTLHARLDRIISLLRKATAHRFPIALITNSSLMYRPSVRKELQSLDLLIPSLDAASTTIFKKINNPHKGIILESIVKGLIQFRKTFKGEMWLEIMLLAGLNDTEKEAYRLKKAVERINPDKIQITLPTRPTPEKLSVPDASSIKKFVSILGPKAKCTFVSLTGQQKSQTNELEKKVRHYLRRRPATALELARALGRCKHAISIVLASLRKKGLIRHTQSHYVFND